MLPVWQRTVRPLVDAGKMIAIGVVQEQHPERTRLYRQWRELDWPIYVDSTNALGIDVVPIPMAIDESGIVRHARIKPNQFVEKFLDVAYPKVEIAEDFNVAQRPNLDELRTRAETAKTADKWRALGEALFDFGEEDSITESVDALKNAMAISPEDGKIHFQLGAALRRRYESNSREPGDAQAAVEHWGHALAANPNQYIWRRRLQQYGPRLDKPYNFYFWVAQARKEIRARGEEPLPLLVEPRGSEIAAPQRVAQKTESAPIVNPDPEGKINRDKKRLVTIEPVVTPARVRPGSRARARVTLRLNDRTRPFWNNEADDLELWVGLPEGLELAEHELRFANPETPETQELRVLEFEVAVAADAAGGKIEAPAYALYYVCEDAGGVCYYLRQDFKVTLTIDAEAPSLK